MKSKLRVVLIAVVLVGAGWAVGRAQARVGDFQLEIDAPGGMTTIRCVRGCALQGARDATVPNKEPVATYRYGCSDRSPRCHATVNGFLPK